MGLLISGSNHFIINAHQFLEKPKYINLVEDEVTVSFDITVIFTSIDLDLTRKITKNSCKNIIWTAYWKQTIYELLEMCPYTCFKSNGDVYAQNKGIPMG